MAKKTLGGNDRHTGQRSTLKFKTDVGDNDAGAQTYEIPISNVDWSREVGTTDIQHNDGLKPARVLTDIRFSGSFSYSGQNYEAINAFMLGSEVSNTPVGTKERHEPARGTLTVREQSDGGEEYIYTFKGCLVTSQSRSVPSDDASESSFDWEAEDMVIKRFDGDTTSTPQAPNSQSP